MHRLLGTTAAINATIFGSVIFGSVGIEVSGAQAQSSVSQNGNALPAVTVDAPVSQKKRSSVASTQRTRSSRAIASANRRGNAVALQTRGPQPQTAGRTTGYVATNSSAGTKTDTPLIETPQSISVVTRKQLEDRNVQTLKDAINYTPGVTTTAFGYDPRFDSFYIRGFDVTYTGIYRDGLRQGGGNFAIPKIEPYRGRHDEATDINAVRRGAVADRQLRSLPGQF